jgi:hypothetical protein
VEWLSFVEHLKTSGFRCVLKIVKDNIAMKELTRGIDDEFASEFKKSKLFTLYENHKDELFIGVRNDYLNLYYNCDSIAKVVYKKTKGIINCEIDKYYLDGHHYTDKDKTVKVAPCEICEKYDTIKRNSENRTTPEKKAQSRLVILNNANEKSKWFCIDIEWSKAFENEQQKSAANFNARFDIIAILKETPHKVALIELKYGKEAFGGNSGIYKHIEDFSKYQKNGYFDAKEIVNIIESQIALGINVPEELQNVTANDITKYEFYVITLDNNGETSQHSTPKQTMAAYLFKDKRWGCKELSPGQKVEETFGDVTNKNNELNVSFLFSKKTLDNLNINDIIDGNYDERILPE